MTFRFLLLAAIATVGLAAPDLAAAQQAGGAACVVNRAGRPTLTGQPPRPIVDLLRQFPAGGEGLTAAVIDIVMSDPSGAANIVAIAMRADGQQKASIALGIVRALARLQRAGTDAVQQVNLALQCADPGTRATIAALESQLFAQGVAGRLPPIFLAGPGGFSSGGGGTVGPVIVSPH